MGTVATLLAENVSFRCTSVDRIGIRGYIPGLQYEGGVLRFLIERGCRIPSPAGLTHNHDRLVSELDALVAAHDVAVVRFKRDECKEDIARPYQLAAAAPTARARAARAPRPSGRPRGTLNAYAPIALAFEPTGPGPRGDLHRPGAGYGIGLTRTGATLALSQGSRRRGAGSSGCRPWGADPAPAVAGADLLAGRANCLRLRGPDPSAWINDIPTYGEVASQGVYPGVDCGDQRQLEYDLVVAPGADPSRIQVLAEGGGRVKLDPKSHLTMTGAKSLGMGRRVAYQIVDGVRQAVEGVLRPQPQQRGWASSWAPTTPPSPWSSTRSSAAPPSWAAPAAMWRRASPSTTAATPASRGPHSCGLPAHRRRLPDRAQLGLLRRLHRQALPHWRARLVYSTYVGGPGTVRGHGIDVDSSGAALYSTLLGGGGDDAALALAVDSRGRIWVGGVSQDSRTDFPCRWTRSTPPTTAPSTASWPSSTPPALASTTCGTRRSSAGRVPTPCRPSPSTV